MRKVSVAISVVMLMTVAACRSQTPARSSPVPTGSTSAATALASGAASSASPTARQAAITAYTSLWHAYVKAVQHPDPSAASLRPYVTGEALKVFQAGLTQLAQQGLAGRGDVILSTPTVASATATTVTLSGCVDTTNTHLYKVDGSAYHDTPGGRRLSNVQVNNIGGIWKVTEWALEAVGTC